MNEDCALTVRESAALFPRTELPITFKFPSILAFPRAVSVVIVTFGLFCKPLALPEVF